ncbi:MAG: hypothetical protein CMJ49_07305 [Planctomycetaceae bacterium]|nr:hypothetical protein [Planctomycetaceae bacterium]
MIADVHTHVYPAMRGRLGPAEDLGYGRVRFNGVVRQGLPPSERETRFTAEQMIAYQDWAGVDHAVLLQGPAYGECNDYAREAVRAYPDRLTAAAYFDPWADEPRRTLEGLMDEQGFEIIKMEFSDGYGLRGLHPEARLDDAAVAWVWETLNGRGAVLVLDLGVIGDGSYQTNAVRAMAEDHRDMTIVIAHLGQASAVIDRDAGARQAWLDQVGLGRLANVWLDVAALPAFFPDESFPYPSAVRVVEEAFDLVGPEKIMWGTDMPGTLVRATYPQMVELGELQAAGLSSAERAAFFGGTGARVYRLPVAGDAG